MHGESGQPTRLGSVSALDAFGFSERQAQFLVRVMLHSGVFVGRQYATFAGITHGQKVHDFIEKLVARRLVTPMKLGSTGRKKILHVHHKRLYAAIGEPDNRNRRPFTLDKAIERLMILDGVLADRSLTWLGSEREKRAYFRERLGDRLRDDEYPRSPTLRLSDPFPQLVLVSRRRPASSPEKLRSCDQALTGATPTVFGIACGGQRYG